jgi:hypothetical protein
VIAADGTSGGWMILEPGDTFTIGEHVFEFRILDPSAPFAVVDEPIEEQATPNVLRDAGPQGQPASSSDNLRTFPLGGMMPSSELAPSASYDDDE